MKKELDFLRFMQKVNFALHKELPHLLRKFPTWINRLRNFGILKIESKRWEQCSHSIYFYFFIFGRFVHMVNVPWHGTACSFRKVPCQMSHKCSCVQWVDNNNALMCIRGQVILYTVDIIIASLPPMWWSPCQLLKNFGNKYFLQMTCPPKDKKRQQTYILKYK